MRGGFTFRDVDIADLSLEYAPELGDTFVYRPTTSEPHEETFEGHDGGYLYGFTKKPKEFTLRCFFEEKDINRGTMEKIYWLFRRGNSGKLVFQKRPWCYYYATVMDVDDKELFNYLNGVIKITMKAYYPFARSDYLTFAKTQQDYFKVVESTAFLNEDYPLPPTTIITDGSTLTDAIDNNPIILYNPGNEYADVGIEIAGNCGTGVTIFNRTTMQECKFVAINSDTVSSSKYIYLDGVNGKCVVKSKSDTAESSNTVNCLFHDHGYIQLAPARIAYRDIYVTSVGNSKAYTLNLLYDENISGDKAYANELYAGKYIYLNNQWVKIQSITSPTVISLYTDVGNGADQTTVIAEINEIAVIPDTTMELTRLNFKYKATFA